MNRETCRLMDPKMDIDTVFSGMDEVRITCPISDVQCPVCLAVTANPRLTMCGHRICMGCAGRLAKRSAPGSKATATIKCPTCSTVAIAHTVPDYRTRDIVMSQMVVCGHKGCSEQCSLRDILKHMKRCKFRVDEHSVLNGAVKRCRDEIEALQENVSCKRRRHRDVCRIVASYNDAIKGGEGGDSKTTDSSGVGRAVGRFMLELRQVVGDEKFRQLYKEECTSYHQSLVDKVKAAATSA